MTNRCHWTKRTIDLAGAVALLILVGPLLLLCAAAILADSRGPVFFRQERLGLNGRVFRIYKLRSMVRDAANSPLGTCTHKNDPRITRVGRILRKYRLDEWPQLINVLAGQMSLVGPRPLVPDFLVRY